LLSKLGNFSKNNLTAIKLSIAVCVSFVTLPAFDAHEKPTPAGAYK